MSERFSILRPLTMIELEWLTIKILEFFSPLQSDEMRQLLGKPVDKGKLLPLSVSDFFNYLRKEQGVIEKYRYHIINLVKKLEQVNFLCDAGKDTGFSMGGEKCYYFIKELTNLQKSNSLWLGECLGLEYIQYKTKKLVIPIAGYANGQHEIGTGTLINNNTILTCKHVLEDMVVDDTITIDGKEIKIADKIFDKESELGADVGLIKLKEPINPACQIVFGDSYMLDEVLTMGYPPVPMARDAYLISQKGEINSFVKNYDGLEYFIYSSITRPGNSGGPIFTKRGQLVGMSVRHLERKTGETENDNIVPFFQGITSLEIIKTLRKLEPNIIIALEDYQ